MLWRTTVLVSHLGGIGFFCCFGELTLPVFLYVRDTGNFFGKKEKHKNQENGGL